MRENRLSEVWMGGKIEKKKEERESDRLTRGTEGIFWNLGISGFMEKYRDDERWGQGS